MDIPHLVLQPTSKAWASARLGLALCSKPTQVQQGVAEANCRQAATGRPSLPGRREPSPGRGPAGQNRSRPCSLMPGAAAGPRLPPGWTAACAQGRLQGSASVRRQTHRPAAASANGAADGNASVTDSCPASGASLSQPVQAAGASFPGIEPVQPVCHRSGSLQCWALSGRNGSVVLRSKTLTCQPARLGQAPHVRCKQDAAAERLGQDEGVPRAEAALAQHPVLVHHARDRKACRQALISKRRQCQCMCRQVEQSMPGCSTSVMWKNALQCAVVAAAACMLAAWLCGLGLSGQCTLEQLGVPRPERGAPRDSSAPSQECPPTRVHPAACSTSTAPASMWCRESSMTAGSPWGTTAMASAVLAWPPMAWQSCGTSTRWRCLHQDACTWLTAVVRTQHNHGCRRCEPWSALHGHPPRGRGWLSRAQTARRPP